MPFAAARRRCGCRRAGELAEGKLADVVLLRQDGAHLFPRNNGLANLVYSSHASDVDTVICNGKLLMLRGRLLSVDLQHVKAEINTRLKRFEPARGRQARRYLCGVR